MINLADNHIAAIEALPGVTATRYWERVPGRERLYIDTLSKNGGKNWNGGRGYRTCYVDLNSGSIVYDGVSGAATRDWHEENRTFEHIARIVRLANTNQHERITP